MGNFFTSLARVVGFDVLFSVVVFILAYCYSIKSSNCDPSCSILNTSNLKYYSHFVILS